MKFLNIFYIFVGHFCPSWTPDTDFESGSGSTDLIESGFKSGSDPKHCWKYKKVRPWQDSNLQSPDPKSGALVH
jgi:hypothetical protein